MEKELPAKILRKKVSLQFVRTVYVCSNQLVASFEEAKKNRMSQIENELETSRLLRDWYRIHKRELPWRESSDPYIIWISEIILQQTRVAQGMDYFLRFTERFPDVASLASAEEDEVLKYLQGLVIIVAPVTCMPWRVTSIPE